MAEPMVAMSFERHENCPLCLQNDAQIISSVSGKVWIVGKCFHLFIDIHINTTNAGKDYLSNKILENCDSR